MKLSIKAGTTGKSIYLFVRDTAVTDKIAGLTGLVHNTSGLTAYHVRTRAASAAITLATLASASAAWSSGGFKEVDATNTPGLYRLDLPDAVLAAGADQVLLYLQGAANMEAVCIEIELTGWDNQDGTAGGISRLDAAVGSRATPAQVATEAAAALTAYDPPTRTEATSDANAILAALTTVDGIVDDILADTGTAIPAQIAALNNLSSAQAQSAAAAALTAYDPPTRTEATSDKSEILTRLGVPTGASIAADIAGVSGGESDPGGSRTVTVTVRDAADDEPIADARVRFRAGAVVSDTIPTDADGQAVDALDDGSWTLSVTKPGYAAHVGTVTVNGDETVTVLLTAIAIAAPDAPELCAVYCNTLSPRGEALPRMAVSFQLQTGPGDAGAAYDSAVFTVQSDVDGLLQVNLVRGATYKIWWGPARNTITVTVPDADTHAMPELISE